MCPRPIAVSTGPDGTVLVLRYDFDKATSKLTTVRLHQPADECIKKEGLKDARDLYNNDRVAFITERGSRAISFCDFKKRVQVDVRVDVKSPDLVSHLQRLGLDTEGTVPMLKNRLKEHLHQIADKIQRLDQVQVRPPLLKPSAICTTGEDVLLCSDDESPNPANIWWCYYQHVWDSHRACQVSSRYDKTGFHCCFGPVDIFLRHTKHFEPGKYV